MHDEFPIAARPEAQDERPKLMIVRGSKTDIAVRQFFRPYVLAFLALAIAVGANGYGYKLAQYFHHSEVSKASATRMWVDHRDDSSVTVAHQQTRPQRISAFRAFPRFCPAGSAPHARPRSHHAGSGARSVCRLLAYSLPGSSFHPIFSRVVGSTGLRCSQTSGRWYCLPAFHSN